MALKFWMGSGRSDKSTKMLEYIVNEACKNPNKEYLVIVPDQFNFAMQKQLVLLSGNKGILNIDVLSFMRLAHRICDEVGFEKSTVTTLDDLGKSLILQLLAEKQKDNLSVYGDKLDKPGYIAKIKSIISEFMQYGIKPDGVEKIINLAAESGKGTLKEKLTDVNVLYAEFLKYINDKYTTTEETLDVVASLVHNSDTVKKSVIIFDGFTGFTPVQMKFIDTLMDFCIDIHVSMLMDDKQKELFDMSQKTINRLEEMADSKRMVIDAPYVSTQEKADAKISVFEGRNPENELAMAVSRVHELVRSRGYRYKDIAMVTGDIEEYRNAAACVFERAGIPYFIDKTQPMLLNPFVEYIRALIEIYTDNYSYESVFRFLKSGLTDFAREDIDRLDNYCLAMGIKGRKKWHTRFIKPNQQTTEEAVYELEQIRQKVVELIDAFGEELSKDNKEYTARSKRTVKEYAVALYNRIVECGIERKLSNMSEEFDRMNMTSQAEEYRQIYVRIMNVMDELATLVPNETVNIKEFGNLMDAGFDGIRIGITPQSMDYVQIGDLTRSRIGDVKVLFVLGANDGIIPQSISKSGIINDSERQFIADNDAEIVLAPTSREDVYTQRLYLYMALKKPDDLLYVSYSKVSNSGKALIPSYFVRKLVAQSDEKSVIRDGSGQVYSEAEAYSKMIQLIGAIYDRQATEEDVSEVSILIRYFVNHSQYKARVLRLLEEIRQMSDCEGKDIIGKAVATAIYGKNLFGSVTRLETYANCAYQYFLRYGLKLNEREVFSFEAKDLGNIYHEVLSEYSMMMKESGQSWFTVDDGMIEDMMEKAVDKALLKDNAALSSTARTNYMKNRISRIMKRTAVVLSKQIKKGEFTPKYFEIGFEQLSSKDSIRIQLSDDEMMQLVGRIDRVDTCEKEEGVYVKIIDYKSSGKDMDLAAVYEGRQLQLIVYLNAAMENERKSGKNVIPAGVFYYHIDDPIIEDDKRLNDEQVEKEIMKSLKLSGLVNSDEEGRAIDLIDMHVEDESTVIKVTKTQKGIKSTKQVISGDDFEVLSRYVNLKMAEIGRSILGGNIGIESPDGINRINDVNCDYCQFKTVCQNGGYVVVANEEHSEESATANGNAEIIEKMKGKLS